MKTFKIVGIVLGVIVLILAIVITMQPSEAHLEKSIVINAPASVIYPQVSNLKIFNEWAPWSKMDPGAKRTYEGADGSVGSKMNWDGSETGTGSQWIEELEDNRHVKSGLTFGNFEGKFYSEFLLSPEASGTRVTWTYDGPNNGLMGKAIWVFMGPMLGQQYDEGLKDLKVRVESNPTR
jgi:hypothetical protein